MYVPTVITLASHVSLLTAVQVVNHVRDLLTEIFMIINASVTMDTMTLLITNRVKVI